jgi:hypothetical protein
MGQHVKGCGRPPLFKGEFRQLLQQRLAEDALQHVRVQQQTQDRVVRDLPGGKSEARVNSQQAKV